MGDAVAKMDFSIFLEFVKIALLALFIAKIIRFAVLYVQEDSNGLAVHVHAYQEQIL